MEKKISEKIVSEVEIQVKDKVEEDKKVLNYKYNDFTDLLKQIIKDKFKDEFTLSEIYEYEEIFKEAYPNNKFIKDKIRQQL